MTRPHEPDGHEFEGREPDGREPDGREPDGRIVSRDTILLLSAWLIGASSGVIFGDSAASGWCLATALFGAVAFCAVEYAAWLKDDREADRFAMRM